MTGYNSLKNSVLKKLRKELDNEPKRKRNIIAYKFISCSEYLFRTLINGEIRLAPPSSFNDPFDCPIELLPGNNEALEKIYKECLKVTCFTRPIKDGNREEDVLFWSHYADSHKGVCIKYKINCDKLPNEESSFSCLLDVDYNTFDLSSINDLKLNKRHKWAKNVRFHKMYHDEKSFGHIQAGEYESSESL